MKHFLMAAFALAGVVALSPVSQTLAGETTVTLGNGDTALVQGGGTKVETDADGNVKVYVNGAGSVIVHTNGGITVRPAVNDATSGPEAGDTLADGTIFAGDGLRTTAADAPGTYTWREGKRYCEDLVANGRDDWTLPTRSQLNALYQNKDTGAFAGTFNDSAGGSTFAHWYWASEEHANNSSSVWTQPFTDGDGGWIPKVSLDLSVRCVRG